jgi:YYY domain-containing protein
VAGAVPGIEPGGETLTWTPEEFWYFDASRVLPVRPGDPESSFQAATEFPLFAWLNGDLHAHMMSQPFMLLVAGLLFAFWHSSDDRHRRLLLVGAVPPVVGLVGITNVWSLPSALGVVALAVLLSPRDPASMLSVWPGLSERLSTRDNPAAEELRRVGVALGTTLLVLVGAVGWTAPFWAGVFLGGPQQEFGYWDSWTPLGPLLIVHGGFLVVIGPYLARSLATERVRPSVLLAGWIGLVAVATALGAPAVGLVVPLVVAGWWLLRARPQVGFPVVLVLAGAGLVVLVELVTIEGERFNVIFKPYAHVWLFWSVATAVLLPRLATGWPAEDLEIDRERLRRVGTVLTVAVVATTGLYAGFAVPAHFGNEPTGADGPTLDGTAYTHQRYPDEAAAIAWLDERPGAPTIVTAAPGGYRWQPEDGNGASAPASLTGAPTVLGWFHEEQYRGEEPYERRLEDVTTIYEGSVSEQDELLDRYDVEYVYVGPAERNTYDLTVEDNPDLEVAFSEGDVAVYEVEG